LIDAYANTVPRKFKIFNRTEGDWLRVQLTAREGIYANLADEFKIQFPTWESGGGGGHGGGGGEEAGTEDVDPM